MEGELRGLSSPCTSRTRPNPCGVRLHLSRVLQVLWDSDYPSRKWAELYFNPLRQFPQSVLCPIPKVCCVQFLAHETLWEKRILRTNEFGKRGVLCCPSVNPQSSLVHKGSVKSCSHTDEPICRAGIEMQM